MSFISTAMTLPSRFISYFIDPASSNSFSSDTPKPSNIHPNNLGLSSSPAKPSTKPHVYKYPRPTEGEFVTKYLARIYGIPDKG